MQTRILYTALALSGASPFVACALLIIAGIDEIPPLGSLNFVVGVYGLAIICFLAGTHWATDLLKPSESRINLFVASNVVFLVVSFAFIVTSAKFALLAQVAAFLFLLIVDHKLLQSALITPHYFRVRSLATGLAVISLLAIVLVPRPG